MTVKGLGTLKAAQRACAADADATQPSVATQNTASMCSQLALCVTTTCADSVPATGGQSAPEPPRSGVPYDSASPASMRLASARRIRNCVRNVRIGPEQSYDTDPSQLLKPE